MATILLLEDDEILREELALFLKEQGHRVLEAASVAEFESLMDQGDVAVIDINLPDGDGFAATARLRARHPSAGAIILTARDTIRDKIQGLTGGADHYLIKPFDLDELGAIIDALLRRVGPGWCLDLKARRLIDPDGRGGLLHPMEMTLFELLSAGTGEGTVVSRRSLVTALGHDWLTYDVRRLEKLVSRLRQRWLAETGQTLPLRTINRQGYAFGASIHRA